MLRTMLVASLLLNASACGPRPPADVVPSSDPVKVEVVNNYALAVEIYVIGSGTTQRLGTVHPGMQGHFRLPPALIGNSSVELQARPTVSAQQFNSGPLLLQAGEIVDFMVASVLFSSTATIRP